MAAGGKKDTSELLRENGRLKEMVRELEAREARRDAIEGSLQASDDRFSAVVNSTSDGVVIVDAAGKVVFWNGAAAKTFGRSAAEMAGRSLGAIIPERSRVAHEERLGRAARTGRSRLAGSTLEMEALRADGTEFPVELSLSTWGSGKRRFFAGIIRDISERKALEERLRALALNDGLTGLPNRVLLVDRLNQAISQSRRNKDLLALLYLDLDRFKAVNDSLGHAAGDEVLRETASRITSCLRQSDTVARMGGDEFTVVLPRIQSAESAGQVAAKILQVIHEPYRVRRRSCQLDASIGITLCPDDGVSPDALLRKADVAMYRAKLHGAPHLQFFAGH